MGLHPKKLFKLETGSVRMDGGEMPLLIHTLLSPSHADTAGILD
jgi:hypothetical protein